MIWIIYAAPAAVIFITALVLYMFWYEPANFKLSEVDIFVNDRHIRKEGEPQEEEEGNSGGTDSRPFLTILHLSDFHLRKNSKGRKLFRFVRSLKDLEPDFIFITGDLVESNRNIDYLVEMLAPLRAKLGKYAILGVHDHYEKAFIEFVKNMFKKKNSEVAVIVSTGPSLTKQLPLLKEYAEYMTIISVDA
ncbi:MAG: 6-hydroxymethylpterin diphosphokinase MptE-like protein, partial [Actinomycetota bacterium]|nr:6-hydroxymethylpterin diphosphokinase MptE-like protein [Actinomycetota bacterium]